MKEGWDKANEQRAPRKWLLKNKALHLCLLNKETKLWFK